MRFLRAIEDLGPPLARTGRPGLSALGSRSNRLRCRRAGCWVGSVDVDRAFRNAEPDAPRWDYGVGFRDAGGAERALWVEVHPATTGDVHAVLRKLRWLRERLIASSRALAQMTAGDGSAPAFVWIATGPVSVRRRSREAVRVRRAGLSMPMRILHLP